MDSLRGNFPGFDEADDLADFDLGEDDAGHEPPPSLIGQDERRMQVRAYNYWASLLDNRQFPSIEDLDPEALPDFGPYSVLLDFTGGIEDPAIPFLGDMLAEECGGAGNIQRLSDVPSRSLLSRITDHYMQILANQAPIGFEAEFVNQRGATILYRGILLPFSSDDDTIDFIYGVINWKELADQKTTDELLLEVEQALDVRPGDVAAPSAEVAPLTEWADGPVDTGDVLELADFADAAEEGEAEDGEAGDVVTGWPAPAFGASDDLALPAPSFASLDDAGFAADPEADFSHAWVDDNGDSGVLAEAGFAADFATPPALAPALADAAGMELADWLASAREMAQAAKGSEDRSRQALYAAIGLAYDFSLAASDEPAQFHELVADSGLTMQDRAPMTPVVKLVFGADYDKTRLTEYASALSHAHRIGLGRGQLAEFLVSAPGGLKGVVNVERRLKREESGKAIDQRDTPREALARKLRKLDHRPLGEVEREGHEFTLLVARRLPTGEVVLLGEVCDDVALLERAARKLIG